MREALYWEPGGSGRVHCLLCPNDCRIAERTTGTCGVRGNRAGRLELPRWGAISSIAVDPIEKKPLYHFSPGSRILSVGFVGCSFRCGFCQNWHISQSTDVETRFISPEALVDIAVTEKSFAIAYTYSEPLVHFEYVLDSAKLARTAGLKNVLVTNGYLNPAPAAELLPFVDAANVDLKAWDADFYRHETGGRLEEVKRFIAEAAGKIHLEVTTLIIPTKNDDPAQIDGIAGFIAGLDPGIPLHLSASSVSDGVRNPARGGTLAELGSQSSSQSSSSSSSSHPSSARVPSPCRTASGSRSKTRPPPSASSGLLTPDAPSPSSCVSIIVVFIAWPINSRTVPMS